MSSLDPEFILESVATLRLYIKNEPKHRLEELLKFELRSRRRKTVVAMLERRLRVLHTQQYQQHLKENRHA